MTDETTKVVLVADDEPAMLSLIAQHTKTLGFAVTLAHDGEEAWEQAERHRPDLVLLDVMMPGMSGWEVCRKIRESRELGHTKVIMITGIGERLNEMTSPLFGADRYLDKPFQLSDLDAAIAQVVGAPKPKTAKNSAAKKSAAKKPAAKKPAAKKPAAKKPAAKKPAAKTSTAKKPAAKKPAAKKPTAKKPAAKRKGLSAPRPPTLLLSPSARTWPRRRDDLR